MPLFRHSLVPSLSPPKPASTSPNQRRRSPLFPLVTLASFGVVLGVGPSAALAASPPTSPVGTLTTDAPTAELNQDRKRQLDRAKKAQKSSNKRARSKRASRATSKKSARHKQQKSWGPTKPKPELIKISKADLRSLDLSLEALARDTHVVFGEEGLVITHVRKGSFADRMGLEKGDRPRSINGLAVTTFDEVLTAWPQLAGQKRFHIVATKRGREVQRVYELPDSPSRLLERQNHGANAGLVPRHRSGETSASKKEASGDASQSPRPDPQPQPRPRAGSRTHRL